MKSTGRLWLLAVCLLFGLVCTQAQEQEKKQLPREVPSPEKAARKMTDRMKEELQLTDKQYDKLYKLNLKEQQEHFATMTERGSGQRPSMGGRNGRRSPTDGWWNGPRYGRRSSANGSSRRTSYNGKGQCGEDAESCCQEGKENQENPDDGTICKVAGNVPTTGTTPTAGSSSQTKFVETLSK